MGSLKRLLAAGMLLTAAPARADQVARWRPYVEEASSRFGVPTSWIERVMHAESRGLTMLNGRPIRSRAGAMGLMQLMPATWAEMRARLALGTNPDDPRDNILAGSFYLRLMYDRFGHPGLFGAYNAGPGAYAAFLAGTRRLPGETIAYLRSVGGKASPPVAAGPPATPPALFVVQRPVILDRAVVDEGERQATLFAIRKLTTSKHNP